MHGDRELTHSYLHVNGSREAVIGDQVLVDVTMLLLLQVLPLGEHLLVGDKGAGEGEAVTTSFQHALLPLLGPPFQGDEGRFDPVRDRLHDLQRHEPGQQEDDGQVYSNQSHCCLSLSLAHCERSPLATNALHFLDWSMLVAGRDVSECPREKGVARDQKEKTTGFTRRLDARCKISRRRLEMTA